MTKDEKRKQLIDEYVKISDAAMRGPGETPHTSKRLKRLRERIEKLGGFK